MRPASHTLSLGVVTLAVTIVLAAFPVTAGSQEHADRANPARRDARPGAEPNRARWARLPEARKERLRRLQERLERVPPAQRRALIERLRRVPAGERRELVQRLQKRSKAERRQLLERHRQLQRWLRSLPADERRRLQQLPQREFARAVERRVDAQRQRVLRAYLETLDPGGRRRFRELGDREREAHLKRFLRQRQTETRRRQQQQLRQFRQRLAALGPAERRAVLRWLEARGDDAALPRGLPEELRVRLQRLPEPQRRALLERLRSRDRPVDGALERRRDRATDRAGPGEGSGRPERLRRDRQRRGAPPLL